MKIIDGIEVSDRFEDIRDRIFNRLTVKNLSDQKIWGTYYWNCLCKCGNYKLVSSSQLKRGIVRSCGCIKSEGNLQGKFIGEITGSFFSSLYNLAKHRGIEFSLTKEYIWNLFLEQNRQCIYSGLEIKFVNQYRENKSNRTASLDRIDSNKGYIEGNVQWVHKDVQFMKYTLSEQRFLELVEYIYINRIEK